MSIQSGCCCVNSENFVIGVADNNRRESRKFSRIIRPLAFLVITSLLAMTVSHVCDKFSANNSFRIIKSDLTNLRNHIGKLSIEVKHVMKMRNKLEDQLSEISGIIQKISQAIHQFDIGNTRLNSNNIENVKNIIKKELRTYDEDKTGRIDYALEASGGKIVSIRDTVPYETDSVLWLSVFEYFICPAKNNPRLIIQAGVLPGQCWAFRGSTGCVVIKLFDRIFISSVSIEHISMDMSPAKETTSAPRDFSFWGLRHDGDSYGFLFGEFTYDNHEIPIQEFPIQNESSDSYEIIEVKFHTNSGNPEYTCVYRIRVHGTLDR